MPDICLTALREAFVGRSYTGLKLVREYIIYAKHTAFHTVT